MIKAKSKSKSKVYVVLYSRGWHLAIVGVYSSRSLAISVLRAEERKWPAATYRLFCNTVDNTNLGYDNPFI